MADGTDQPGVTETPPEPPTPPTPEEAMQALERDREARVAACLDAVRGVLESYRCELDTQMTISGDGRVIGRSVIVSK